MDKQGVLYFKLLTGVFLLVLAGYGLGKLFPRSPAYQLYSTQICEVGDGITVSGFAVRYESLLYSGESPTFLSPEGQWIGGGQTLATTKIGTLLASQGGYLSYSADGYEGLLTPEFILNCKEEDFQALSPATLPSHTVGKMIHGQSWYFAVPGTFPQFKTGDKLRLSIEGKQWEVTVRRTQEVLVLECRTGLAQTLSFRQATARLLSHSSQGIPLPPRAIYYDKGDTYVYILQGSQARRKCVHISLITEDSLWISPEDLPPGAQVILTDTEITDGMVLK